MTVDKHYVQFGAGLCGPSDWLNFDASPTLRLQRLPLAGWIFRRRGPVFPKSVRFGNIVTGLPIEDQSCHGIYSSHVLEHLSLDDFRQTLRNSHDYLVPGGILRFVLPDLERHINDYVSDRHERSSIKFMEATMLGCKRRANGLVGRLRSQLGNASHLWMWDYPGIEAELKDAGFTQIRRAAFGDSKDPRFQSVEAESRWEGCLGVECIRPAE